MLFVTYCIPVVFKKSSSSAVSLIFLDDAQDFCLCTCLYLYENSGSCSDYLKGLSNTIKICLNSSINGAYNSDVCNHFICGYGNVDLELLSNENKCSL